MGYHLFEACGIEIEYMVVDMQTGSVRQEVEHLLDSLEAINGPDPETAFIAGQDGNIAAEWCNELVAHVAEAKCHMPVPNAAAFHTALRRGVEQVNGILAQKGCRLMPSAAHPWMNPDTDAALWPRDEEGIYAEYDRIFGCNTHGWTNLQSVHINLPFQGTEEFARLHAAIRLVLPLVPALAAASPYLDGKFTGKLDKRMDYYRINSLRIPAMTGELIPEAVYTPEAYYAEILEKIYSQTAPLDPKGILHDEWANARGAIARFDRSAIEIRVMDSQECPLADLACAHAITQVTRLLVEERFCSLENQKSWQIAPLYDLFFEAVHKAEQGCISPEYANLFGAKGKAETFQQLWAHLITQDSVAHPLFAAAQDHYLCHGPLARRMLKSFGTQPSHAQLYSLVATFCQCLKDDTLFL